MKTLNSYEQFFELIPKDQFFRFGLENIVTIPANTANREWNVLVERIANKTQGLFVRSSGRNGNGNGLLSQLYASVFGISINFDPTNNREPTALLQRLTGHRKNQTIFNYQVSHVFGRTKNVFCFTAPWNIVFIPKIVDPLTGHEAKGAFVHEFRFEFQTKILRAFQAAIRDFNAHMLHWGPLVRKWVADNVPEKDRDTYLKEFEEIPISTPVGPGECLPES